MKRKAFTLIEIMVAIGIIVILAGLAVYAMKGSANTAKVHATHVTLENLKSLLAEYDLKTKLGTWPAAWYRPDTGAAYAYTAGDPVDFWYVPYRLPWTLVPPYNPPVPLTQPGLVADGDGRTMPAILNTAIALNEIEKIPANAANIAKLPANSLAVIPAASLTLTVNRDCRIVLDSWNNPIIIVPGSGLAGVTVGGNTVTITAPGGRPFFASAGPDGNFANGDDNVYSFEQ